MIAHRQEKAMRNALMLSAQPEDAGHLALIDNDVLTMEFSVDDTFGI